MTLINYIHYFVIKETWFAFEIDLVYEHECVTFIC
jgi:hypothetical protein